MREGLDQFSSWSLKANQDGGKSWLIRGKPRQTKERAYSKAIEWKKKPGNMTDPDDAVKLLRIPMKRVGIPI